VHTFVLAGIELTNEKPVIYFAGAFFSFSKVGLYKLKKSFITFPKL